MIKNMNDYNNNLDAENARARKEISRTHFARRSKEEGVDIRDYANEEDRILAGLAKDSSVDLDCEKQALEKSRAVEKGIMESVKVKEKSFQDPLTGAKNLAFYRQVTERLQKESSFARNPGQSLRHSDQAPAEIAERPFSLLTIDIDHFKNINDAYGHAAGDDVLKELVARIAGRLRQGDVLARCGGEEFRIVALAANGGAPIFAEAIRGLIADRPFKIRDNGGKDMEIIVTASIGVSPYDERTEEMERLSDTALYAAKDGRYEKSEAKETRAGRNQVWVWDKESNSPKPFDLENDLAQAA